MTRQEAAAVVAMLAAAFPAFPPSRETVAIYVDAMLDLDWAETRDAAHDLIRTEERFPAVASIRRRVCARAGLLAPTGAQAWDEVNAASGNGGRSRSQEWSHPAIADTVRAIGWWALCSSINPETTRAQFLRLYDDVRRRHDENTMITPGALTEQKSITA